MYIGPLSEPQVDVDGGSLASGALSDFQTAANTFLGALSTAGYPLAVLSRKNSAYTLVTSAVAESTIATQRRRIRS